jgi:serine/threonine-protein kinase RsbT
MTVQKSETLAVQSDSDIVFVRQRVRAWAVEMQFSLVDQTKLVTAASELARNTVEHGHGGELCMEVVSNEVKKGLRLTFADRGPGIPDVPMALKDGFSTGGGMGLGLSGSRRLVHDFDLQSKPGEGTRVMVTRWK